MNATLRICDNCAKQYYGTLTVCVECNDTWLDAKQRYT